MRLAVKTTADRSFFYITITNVDNSVEHWNYVERWSSIKRKASTDLQRSYLAAILGLEKANERDSVTEIVLYVDSRMIDRQLRGVSMTGTEGVAILKSELIGLMTRIGAVYGGSKT